MDKALQILFLLIFGVILIINGGISGSPVVTMLGGISIGVALGFIIEQK